MTDGCLRTACLALFLAVSGCQSGNLGVEEASHRGDARPHDGDTGTLQPLRDGGNRGDGGGDGGLVPRDAEAGDGGDAGDAGPAPGPCAEVTCGDNAACDPGTGACACAPGFVDDGGECVAPSPGDPAGRTATQVCDRWDEGHRMEAASPWEPGSETCDPGTMSRAAIEDTLRRINMHRWLAGRGPVTDVAGLHDAQMECARIMAANNDLSHDPPESWDCYTEDGASAAGRSNITYGRASAADAVDAYMRDLSTPNLGHRRWILNKGLGQVGIGFSGGGDCLAVIDTSGSSDRDWVAYPNPGPAPLETTRAAWSYHGPGLGSDPSVAITRLRDGSVMPVTDVRTMRASFYREGGIGWSLSDWRAEAGERYRVSITAGDDSVEYVVEPVDCGGT